MILKTTTTKKLKRFPLSCPPRTQLLLNLFVLVFLPCTIYPTTAALCNVSNAVADLGGEGVPLRAKIFSISCSFSQNRVKSYVGAPLEGWRPLLRGILDPPLQWLFYSLLEVMGITQFGYKCT